MYNSEVSLKSALEAIQAVVARKEHAPDGTTLSTEHVLQALCVAVASLRQTTPDALKTERGRRYPTASPSSVPPACVF